MVGEALGGSFTRQRVVHTGHAGHSRITLSGVAERGRTGVEPLPDRYQTLLRVALADRGPRGAAASARAPVCPATMTRHAPGPPAGVADREHAGDQAGERRQERQQHVAKRVVLHIGTMKSGTSFVQSGLMANAALLDAAGARYLGGTFGRQAKAVRDLYQAPRHAERHGRWLSLAEEARGFEGSVGIISMEFLSFAERRQLDALLTPLSGLDVEVVLTVRDQFRAIPAQWQTFTRNFGTDDWETYLRRIDASPRTSAGKSRAAKSFRRSQSVDRILQRWSDPRVSRTTVVTVPAPDAPREELWRRFCRAAGIAALEDAQLEETQENLSIGYASCDFMRRLNVHLSEVRPRFYRKGIRPMVREALAPLRDSEARPALDRRGAELARDLNDRIRQAIDRAGHELIGSLDDLPLPDGVEAPDRPAPPEPADVRRAALAARAQVSQDLGLTPEAPSEDLDDLVAEVAGLLGKLHRWGL